MKSAYALCIILIIITSIHASFAQKYIVRDIKTFGAKGDGRTNDHNAFQRAAAYFNNRGGNGKLIISKGTYIIGKQIFTGGKPGKPAYEGEDLLRFIKLKNFKITGTTMSILKYKDSLRFGSFSPATGMRYDPPNNLFQNSSYAAAVGNCIFFEECRNISVTNLSIDGNNKSMAVGGFFNTSGIQLPHYGIFIKNSNNVIIDNINVHHFGLDGICVSNIVSQQKDSISILNSSFQYNVRQGLSWIGGNYLVVNNCKF
ncbi:MAG: glycosyl hydrolase family 28-related protein, partial [Ginsengibacter sp.]